MFSKKTQDIILMAAMLGGGLPSDLFGKPRKKREFTNKDQEALDAAQAKRERKANKRIK